MDFENYHEASQNYDSTRVAFGVEVILGSLSYGTKRALKDLHILDAGCGTGNYLVALSEFVGKVTGLELNGGMLKKAKEKTAHLKNVEVMQGNIADMPFPDGHFDGICCNMVIHHLDAPGSSDFVMIKKFISEAHRVLKPGGGTLLINTIAPEQCKTPWYFSIVPQAQEQLSKKLPSIPLLQEFLTGSGFTQGPAIILTDILFKPEDWNNKEGPLSKEWRNTVSVFALAPELLEEALARWKEKIDSGEADQSIAESEELRKKIGLSTSVVAYKH